MTFKVCDRCKGVSVKTLVPKLKEINPQAEIQIGCQGFCGIGRSKPFVIVDHMSIIADDEDQLIEKVKETLTK